MFARLLLPSIFLFFLTCLLSSTLPLPSSLSFSLSSLSLSSLSSFFGGSFFFPPLPSYSSTSPPSSTAPSSHNAPSLPPPDANSYSHSDSHSLPQTLQVQWASLSRPSTGRRGVGTTATSDRHQERER